MSDVAGGEGEAVQLFGDPRSKFIERGPDRRSTPVESSEAASPASALGRNHSLASSRPDDVLSTALAVLGLLVFGAAIIAGALILYNAKSVGAFRNPWDSTRVAIGITVLAVGIVQAAILIGLSRLLSYFAAERRRHT